MRLILLKDYSSKFIPMEQIKSYFKEQFHISEPDWTLFSSKLRTDMSWFPD